MRIFAFFNIFEFSFLDSGFCFTGRFDIIQRTGDQLEMISLGKVQEFMGDILRSTVGQKRVRHPITRKMCLRN